MWPVELEDVEDMGASDSVDSVAYIDGEATGHAFEGRVGQRQHCELIRGVDEPLVAIGPIPLQRSP